MRTRIIVIGDAILDRYISGEATRLSPEAPVPVVNIQNKQDWRLGGAANVAANISALGHEVILITTRQPDVEPQQPESIFTELLQAARIAELPILDYTRFLPVKTRLIANGHQLARMDEESVCELHAETVDELLAAVTAQCRNADENIPAIVVSDYGKGTVTRRLMRGLDEIAGRHCIALLLDPKPGNADSYYGLKHLTIMTPNMAEAEKMSGETDIDSIVEELLGDFSPKYLVITRGAQGMSLVHKDLGPFELRTFLAPKVPVFDVSGAGDTALAALAVGLTHNYGMHTCVAIAVAAASRVVTIPGTAVIDKTFSDIFAEVYPAGVAILD